MARLPILFFLIAASLAGPVLADGIPSPTRVIIPAPGQSAPLTITNTGAQPSRFTLTPLQWQQGEDGVPQLLATDDIALSEETLSINAGASATVQVRSREGLPQGEHAYRISIRPSDDVPDASQGTKILRVIDLPVFVGAPLHPADLHLDGVQFHAGMLSALLVNHGGGFVRPQRVEVIGFDAAGNEVIRQSWEGWYILGSGRRRYELSITPDQCAAVARFNLGVTMSDGAEKAAATPWTADICMHLATSEP